MAEVKIRTDRIQKLVAEQELEPGQLAYKADISPAQVYRMLNDERPYAQAITIGKIAAGLDTSSDYLLNLTINPFPPHNPIDFDSEVIHKLVGEFHQLDPEHQRLALAQMRLLVAHLKSDSP